MPENNEAPREKPDNIVYYCPEHAPAPIRYGGPLEELVGKWVKKGFIDPEVTGIREHMWVKVESVAGKTLIGYLDSVPAHVANIKLHDPVTLEREEIEDVHPPEPRKIAS